MTTPQSVREAFEAWARTQTNRIDALNRKGDGYVITTAQIMWLAWQAAHAREVEANGAYIREADRRVSELASLLNQANVIRLREVEALRLRAEAAEGAMRTIASTQEGRMAIAKAIHIELDKVDAWLDAAIASGGEG